MSSTQDRYVVGVDFGTLSGRALVVRVSDGEELGTSVHEYPHAVMDRELAETGERLPSAWALQDPGDYLEVLQNAIPDAVQDAGIDPARVVGVGIDFTSCTILPTTSDGTPLCRLDEFRERPHAYVKLWKHHAAQPQADRVTQVAADREEAWLARYGGRISSEWAVAKALQVLDEDPEVYERMDRWVEAGDWIVWQLCGEEVRSVCIAGYKSLYQDDRYPSRDYFAALDDRFADFAADKLAESPAQLGARAGSLTAQAAEWTGLPEGIAVAVGNVDAHVTAPAAKAIEPGDMLLVMGTSTCQVMVADEPAEVPGMCGAVRGGVVADRWGFEAGQSGVGDIFAWLVENAVSPSYHERAEREGVSIHELLTSLSADQAVGEHGLVALDWWSGNRSILVDHELTGVFVGLTLSSRAEDMYRALIEATAFGARRIVEAFEEAGIAVERLVCAGGLLENKVLMQIYADVLNRSLDVLGSSQGGALGAAIHAAVAAGCYDDVPTAAGAMGRREEGVYEPDAQRARSYDRLYGVYTQLHDWFGRDNRGLMRDLQEIREQATERGEDRE